VIGPKVAEMSARREAIGGPPLKFGAAGYAIVRSTEAGARKEVERITDVRQSGRGYGNYRDWIQNTKLERQVSLEDYSVSNRGLRSGLVGTPAQVAERILEFEACGVDLLLLQFSPQSEEMERFAEEVIPLVRSSAPRRPGLLGCTR
jgi:dimethylsulfone monooxygenase